MTHADPFLTAAQAVLDLLDTSLRTPNVHDLGVCIRDAILAAGNVSIEIDEERSYNGRVVRSTIKNLAALQAGGLTVNVEGAGAGPYSGSGGDNAHPQA
jgi:hypothetical protein